MKLAIISDIHANLPALEVTMKDIRKENVDGIYCLEDLVNFARWDNEVIQWKSMRILKLSRLSNFFIRYCKTFLFNLYLHFKFGNDVCLEPFRLELMTSTLNGLCQFRIIYLRQL